MSNKFKSDKKNLSAPEKKILDESRKASELIIELFSVNEVPVSTALLALMWVVVATMEALELPEEACDDYLADLKSNLYRK